MADFMIYMGYETHIPEFCVLSTNLADFNKEEQPNILHALFNAYAGQPVTFEHQNDKLRIIYSVLETNSTDSPALRPKRLDFS